VAKRKVEKPAKETTVPRRKWGKMNLFLLAGVGLKSSRPDISLPCLDQKGTAFHFGSRGVAGLQESGFTFFICDGTKKEGAIFL